VRTLSGRTIPDPPRIRLASERLARADLKRHRAWLIEQAKAEAKACDDDYCLLMFSGETASNLPPASAEAMNVYLFGEIEVKQ
jgi:hypothetical protein